MSSVLPISNVNFQEAVETKNKIVIEVAVVVVNQIAQKIMQGFASKATPKQLVEQNTMKNFTQVLAEKDETVKMIYQAVAKNFDMVVQNVSPQVVGAVLMMAKLQGANSDDFVGSMILPEAEAKVKQLEAELPVLLDKQYWV